MSNVGTLHRHPVRDQFRRLIERLLPWYDVEEEARRAARTEAIRRRSIAARISIEQLSPEAQRRIRLAYLAYARELAG